MKILVDAIPLTELLTGIQRYVRCLYTELEALPDVSVTYFGRTGHGPEMPPQADAGCYSRRIGFIRKFPEPIIVGGRILDRMHYEWRLRQLERKSGFDIFHETAFFPPVVEQVPVVYTIYDLSLIKHPDKHPRERVWFSDIFFKRRLPRASHIITISNFIREELIQDLRVPPHRITAIHLAQGPKLYRRPSDEVREMLDRRGLPGEYILFVGTLEPRKNLQLLVRALPLLKSKIPLLLTGWSGWGDRKWWEEIQRLGLRERTILTGHVDEDALACLYSGAAALVYPSLYEGFGLPVIEAMACGCPVVCSTRASLPEVAGEAAVLVDPHDPAGLAEALERIIDDSEHRNRLIEAGFRRAKLFSWRKTALETLEVFRGVADNRV